jgi:hypothetical protein
MARPVDSYDFPGASMTLLRRYLVLTLIFVCAGFVQSADIRLDDNTTIHFANKGEGGEILRRRDEYVVLMSPFDRAARLNSASPVSEERLLQHLARQALDWSAEEIAKFTSFADSIRPVLRELDPRFPAVINMVKTTSEEEGGANVAYTRQNHIFFTTKMLENAGGRLKKVFIHELFHVLSRQNPDLREQLYAVIGFKKCNEIMLPDDLAVRRLTNPDAPTNDNYIQVGFKDSTVKVIPLLYSREQIYDPEIGKTIFDYLVFELMVVRKVEDIWHPALKEGKPWLLGVREVSGFFEQIGNNTQYIMHPEEILAENFVLVVDGDPEIPTPRVPQEMREIFMKYKNPEESN